MSSSDAEVDISVVSSPEPSPRSNRHNGCESPQVLRAHSASPAHSPPGSSPPLLTGTASPTTTTTTAAGTPTLNGQYPQQTTNTAAVATSTGSTLSVGVPPNVLHHHLQHHLSSLGHPQMALHHALHSFSHHLHPAAAHAAAHQQLLQQAAVVTPSQQTQLGERLSPPIMAAVAPHSPCNGSERSDEVASLGHVKTVNNNNKSDRNDSSPTSLLGNTAGNGTENGAGAGGKATTGNGFTSFSISSILSRSEPTKKQLTGGMNGTSLITPIPQLPQAGPGAPQDAAMLSR